MKKIKKGDKVKVMRGKDAGKIGEVLRYINAKNEFEKDKVVVSSVNIVKRAKKPNPSLGIIGGITEKEMPIDVSNVMIYDEETSTVSRVGFKFDEETNKKYRYLKKSGKKI